MGQDKLVEIMRSDGRVQGMIYSYDAEDYSAKMADPDRLSIYAALEAEKGKPWVEYHSMAYAQDVAGLETAFWDRVWSFCFAKGWRVVDVRDDSIWEILWFKAQPSIEDDVNGWRWAEIKAEIDSEEWGPDWDDSSQEVRAICLGSEWSILPTENDNNPNGQAYSIYRSPRGHIHLHYDLCPTEDADEDTGEYVEYPGDDPEWRHFYVEEWESAMSDAAGAVGLCFWFDQGDGWVGEYRDKEEDDDDQDDDQEEETV